MDKHYFRLDSSLPVDFNDPKSKNPNEPKTKAKSKPDPIIEVLLEDVKLSGSNFHSILCLPAGISAPLKI